MTLYPYRVCTGGSCQVVSHMAWEQGGKLPFIIVLHYRSCCVFTTSKNVWMRSDHIICVPMTMSCSKITTAHAVSVPPVGDLHHHHLTLL